MNETTVDPTTRHLSVGATATGRKQASERRKISATIDVVLAAVEQAGTDLLAEALRIRKGRPDVSRTHQPPQDTSAGQKACPEGSDTPGITAVQTCPGHAQDTPGQSDRGASDDVSAVLPPYREDRRDSVGAPALSEPTVSAVPSRAHDTADTTVSRALIGGTPRSVPPEADGTDRVTGHGRHNDHVDYAALGAEHGESLEVTPLAQWERRNQPPRVGSVWESRDPREPGRQVEVVRVDTSFATVKGQRLSRIRLPLTRRYRLVRDGAR